MKRIKTPIQANRDIVVNCGVEGCCPVMKIHGDKVCICDDYGHEIHISVKQFNYLIREYTNTKNRRHR